MLQQHTSLQEHVAKLIDEYLDDVLLLPLCEPHLDVLVQPLEELNEVFLRIQERVGTLLQVQCVSGFYTERLRQSIRKTIPDRAHPSQCQFRGGGDQDSRGTGK